MPPEAQGVNMEARVEPLTGSLPVIAWRWDPETDILSGAFKGNRKSGGLTGTVELTDDEGSVAVLDVNNGVICGLDVVVWPEVATSPTLQVAARIASGLEDQDAFAGSREIDREGATTRARTDDDVLEFLSRRWLSTSSVGSQVASTSW